MCKQLVIFLMILALNEPVQAQTENYRFVNFSTKDGLLDKVVYNTVQDKKGYMWFSTAAGLYRYDGHHFKYYRSPLDKAGSTIANVLQGIMCDKSGNLWLGSLNTLQWYNPTKNIFWQPDLTNPENKKITSSYFYNFSEGKYIWCSSAKNFAYRFDKKDSTFLPLSPNYPEGATVASLNTAEAGNYLYDIHTEGIYIFGLDGKFIKQVKHTKADISNGYYNENENVIYLPTYTSGLLKFDIHTQVISDAIPVNGFLSKSFIYSVAKDAEGNYYLGDGTLLLYKPGSSQVLDFSSSKTKTEFSFGADKIVNIVFDREKNIWFCSHNGLSMLPWQNSQVKTIMLREESNGYITEPIGVYREPGTKNLLIANTTSRGLQHVDAAAGKVTTVINNYETEYGAKSIKGLIITPDNSVYASDDNRFFKYNPATKNLTPFTLNDQQGKPIGPISRNVTDKNRNIFIGSPNNGFYIWNYNNGKLTHYNKWDITKSDSTDKDNNLVPCIADNKQNIWFTSSDGIYEFRQNENKYYHHTPPDNSGEPPMGESRYIAEDKNGHIWVATQNNGLYELYVENGNEKWKNYNANSGIGLPTDYINKIKQSPLDSCLWLNNTAGLLKFDPVQKRVLGIMNMQNGLYGEGHGYTFNMFSDNTLAQLFFGALNIIDLNSYKQNTFRPVVQFNSIKVMDREMLFLQPGNQDMITVPDNENFLQFEFTALVFNNANRNQYAWMLEGADKNWVYGGQVNMVSYSGLKPGTYTFKVKAANNDGLWGEETFVKIKIKPPFYATWWFILLSILMLGALIYLWNKLRINQAKKEEKLKALFQQQIAETEMKALRAQMNPHFIFNSLNSIQKYILKNDHFAASQYLTKFSRLIRLILDHSNQNTILVSSELDLLRLYIEMESLRFDNKFDYSVEVAGGINTDTVLIPSMLIQPYVENAIWHGLLHKEEKGLMKINFTKEGENDLVVTIEDNGVGREKAAEMRSKQVLKKKSYGMQITEDRIAIINRTMNISARAEIIDLKNEAGNASGTKVVLHIPLQPALPAGRN